MGEVMHASVGDGYCVAVSSVTPTQPAKGAQPREAT